jgi:hypothetical protein
MMAAIRERTDDRLVVAEIREVLGAEQDSHDYDFRAGGVGVPPLRNTPTVYRA